MSAARRWTAAVFDSVPVLLLAGIAGAGSFAHIRDTAAEHGQRGPMSWAVAVCVDLTCAMAARECPRDKRHGILTRHPSWPTVVLAGGVLLSLAANLAQAEPSVWGQVMAATPCAAFLVAVSMLERRASTPHQRGPGPDAAVLRAVPGQDEGGVGPSGSGQPSRTETDTALVAAARHAATEHQATHGQPITRDALRARLGVSNQLASDLLRQIRTPAGHGDRSVTEYAGHAPGIWPGASAGVPEMPAPRAHRRTPAANQAPAARPGHIRTHPLGHGGRRRLPPMTLRPPASPQRR